MIELKKHSSYEDPPDLPYFTGSRKKGKHVQPTPVDASSASPTEKSVGVGLSPSLRGECINHIDRWYTAGEGSHHQTPGYATLSTVH